MTKSRKITYWVATLWLALGMAATGVQQLMHAKLEGALSPPGEYGMQDLGYPLYLLTLLGVWKLLSVVAILVPRFPVVKEWAYAGIFFLLTGALWSHLAVGHPSAELFPGAFLLALLVISWLLRPESRKVAARTA
ncbi:MAG: DoxX family protein [Flavobacteriales bacterium]|nr:DoxX family protein [Flavobacteriales bacterium]MCL4280881.1 DoxX family protein [Flavobacteriales bacterium]